MKRTNVHRHTPQEGLILDDEGHDSGERWVSCKTCGADLGIKRSLAGFSVSAMLIPLGAT